MTVIWPGEEIAFLHPLPVGALWGVGPATQRRLDRLAVRTVGDLAALPIDTVLSALGQANGRHLHELANGIDARRVEPDQKVKSIGHEETFAADHFRLDTLRRELVRMADATAARLRENGLSGRTVTLKVRFGDFRTITRSRTAADPVSSGPAIARVAKELLDGVDPGPGVRLLGVSVSGLVEGGTRQLTLDEASSAVMGRRRPRRSTRSGRGSARRRSCRHRWRGPTASASTRRGDQQWGPGDAAESERPRRR